MDIDSIPFGSDFRDHIRNALFDSDVLVAVVGPKWLGPGKGSHLRIKEENDPIRIEVETALEREIPVIPVLVNGAVMPKPSELPAALEGFAFRNAAEIDSGRDFHPHMDRLIRSIDRILQASGKQLAAPGSAVGSTATTAAVVAEPAAADAPEVVAEANNLNPSPAPPVVAAGLVGKADTTEPAAPAAKPKSGAATIVFVAAGAAAVAVAIAGLVVWLYVRPTPPTNSKPAVVAQPQPAPRPQPVQPSPQAPTVVAGCPGKPAFHDDFKTADPGWDVGETQKVEDGKFVIKPQPGRYSAALYPSLIYRNATICLDVQTPPAANDLSYGGGLIFWAEDYSNFYLVTVTSDGRYRINRRVDGAWRTIRPYTGFEGLKQGYGVTNQIKVSTAGNNATLYLNDRKVQDIKGQPPKAGGSVGMYGTSEDRQINEWRFLDIAVVELPVSQTITVPPSQAATQAMLTACKLGPPAVFSDDFKVKDGGWSGLADDRAYYADNHLVVKPPENKVWRVLNLGLIYKNVTICADLKSPTQIKAENDTAAGVSFWVADFDNNYFARIFPDGSYSVSRLVDDKVISVVPKTKTDAVNKGPGAQNRVKIELNGGVATLYINDVKVRDFRGQPPAIGSSFGLYADSEAGQRSEWGFTGIVVVEP